MNLHIIVHMKDEIINYIKRSISDIARKCGVSDTDVIKEMKELCNR
jgi:hypothetical protein